MSEADRKRQEKTEENLGKAVMGIAWIFFAIKFIVIASVLALPVVWLLHKPLWIAPIVGVVLYILWRVVWRAFWRFVTWSTRD
jgi:hypothetical protein